MDEFFRTVVDARGVWGGKGSVDEVPQQPAPLESDYEARVLALLVERAGGRVEIDRDEVRDLHTRMMLVPYLTESGLILETRRLARGDDAPR